MRDDDCRSTLDHLVVKRPDLQLPKLLTSVRAPAHYTDTGGRLLPAGLPRIPADSEGGAQTVWTEAADAAPGIQELHSRLTPAEAVCCRC